MSIIDDLQWVQHELSALKSYSPPDMTVLVQKRYEQPANSGSGLRTIQVRFVDNTRHMIWALPTGVDYFFVSSIRGDGLVIYKYSQRAGENTIIVFSSFDDFEVST